MLICQACCSQLPLLNPVVGHMQGVFHLFLNKEFQLLLTLVRRSGRIQSRERLLQDIWDMHSEVYTRTVDTHVKRLREKLGKMGAYIETVRGMGYRFREEDED